MKEFTAFELLAAREKRVDLITKLLKCYITPLLVMRVNYPGLQKMNELTLRIMKDMSPLLRNSLGGKVCGQLLLQGAEGPILYLAVQEDVIVLKRAAVNFEETHPLGRCLDIDVYDLEGNGISRQELGYPRRKCYLCEEDAHLCVRARRHNEHEVIGYIQEKYQEYREKVYGREE